MSFRNTLDDIKNVTPAELGGVATTDLPPNTESRAVHVSNTGGSILFDLVAATADEGGGVTASATAPDSPSENDLWYDTDGSGEEGPSQLYIYTTVEGSNMDWVAVTPTAALPNLPPMSAAGSYSLVVGDDSSLSWALAESGDSGGDTGGGSTPTYTTDASYNGNTAGSIVIPEAGRWQFTIVSRSTGGANRTIAPACTSGFDQITGGFYEWNTIVAVTPVGSGSPNFTLSPLRRAHARWDSINNQFRIATTPDRVMRNLGNGTGLLRWDAEWDGVGSLATGECMLGTIDHANVSTLADIDSTNSIPQNTYTYGMALTGSTMTGELITSGAVTITFYGNTSGTLLNSGAWPYVYLNKIT